MEFQKALDNLQNAKRKQKKRQKRNMLIGVPIGVALGLAISFFDNLVLKKYEGGTLWLFLMLLFTLPIQLILHEMGHLIFGLFTGYRFCSFRVFSFAILKKDGKLCFGRYRVPGTLGQCLVIPPIGDAAIKTTPLLLGGVIVNSVTALLSFLPLLLFFNSLAPIFRFFLIGVIFWGVALALSNGIPQKNGAIANDGYHAKVLPKDKAARHVFFHQLRISAAVTEGKRLCEMPSEWFATPKDQPIDPLSATLTRMLAEREMDLGKFDAAKEMLVDLANRGEDLPEFQLASVLCELLYLEMVGSHRLDVVETLRCELTHYLKITHNSLTALRIEMTYHYLFTGDMEKLDKLQKRFESLAKRIPFAGEVARERLLATYPESIYRAWRDACG